MPRIHPFYEDSNAIYLNLPESERGGKLAEAELYKLLKEQLPEEWYVIYDYRCQGVNQPNQIDFLVIVPGYGIANLECKGGGYKVSEGGSRFNHAVPTQDFDMEKPRSVISNAFDAIMRTFYPDWPNPRRSPLAYAYAVIFPTVNFTTNGQQMMSGQTDEYFNFGTQHVYTMKDVTATSGDKFPLKNIILNCFPSWAGVKPDFFQQDEAERIYEHYRAIGKTTREILDLDAELANARLRDFLTGAVDGVCDFIFSPGIYKNIKGAAGTGKTWVAMETARRFAEQARREGKKSRILYVCYNVLLAAEMHARLESFSEVSVTHFHRLLRALFNLSLSFPDNISEADMDKQIYEAIRQIPQARLKELKFDLILVDEAQDFNRCKIETLFQLTKRRRKMAFFWDMQQNIHDTAHAMEEIYELQRLDCPTEERTLRRVLRCSKRIQQYTAGLINDDFSQSIELEGPEISIHQNVGYPDLQKQLNVMEASGIAPSRIAILWDALNVDSAAVKDKLNKIKPAQWAFLDRDEQFKRTCKNLQRWHSSDNVRYLWATSLQKFKGLEADYILLLLPQGNETLIANHYVGATRAKYKLHVFMMSPSIPGDSNCPP